MMGPDTTASSADIIDATNLGYRLMGLSNEALRHAFIEKLQQCDDSSINLLYPRHNTYQPFEELFSLMHAAPEFAIELLALLAKKLKPESMQQLLYEQYPVVGQTLLHLAASYSNNKRDVISPLLRLIPMQQQTRLTLAIDGDRKAYIDYIKPSVTSAEITALRAQLKVEHEEIQQHSREQALRKSLQEARKNLQISFSKAWHAAQKLKARARGQLRKRDSLIKQCQQAELVEIVLEQLAKSDPHQLGQQFADFLSRSNGHLRINYAKELLQTEAEQLQKGLRPFSSDDQRYQLADAISKMNFKVATDSWMVLALQAESSEASAATTHVLTINFYRVNKGAVVITEMLNVSGDGIVGRANLTNAASLAQGPSRLSLTRLYRFQPKADLMLPYYVQQQADNDAGATEKAYIKIQPNDKIRAGYRGIMRSISMNFNLARFVESLSSIYFAVTRQAKEQGCNDTNELNRIFLGFITNLLDQEPRATQARMLSHFNSDTFSLLLSSLQQVETELTDETKSDAVQGILERKPQLSQYPYKVDQATTYKFEQTRKHLQQSSSHAYNNLLNIAEHVARNLGKKPANCRFTQEAKTRGVNPVSRLKEKLLHQHWELAMRYISVHASENRLRDFLSGRVTRIPSSDLSGVIIDGDGGMKETSSEVFYDIPLDDDIRRPETPPQERNPSATAKYLKGLNAH